MNYSPSSFTKKGRLSLLASVAALLLTAQSGFSAPGDKVHAFYADEHNTTPTGTTGNRILEIDIENMTLVNSLDVPGNAGHHADNGFNSKIYGVPKGSGFVNVIKLTKDVNDTTSMAAPTQIPLIHKPRSGDAYNKKFNVILMAAANRPMGSFIDVETDTVVGTIGENVDCRLTDGSMLLSHADANTVAAATKYHCETSTHGGTQVSGHPYWLTSDYAAIVDRTNNQISTYFVWKDGVQLKSRLVNHLATRSSIHQIIPRDRTALPQVQQADFYATEEGEHVGHMNSNGRGLDDADYAIGKPHALLHMKLTTNGLELVRRMDLQRTTPLSKAKSDRILDACISIYRGTFSQSIALFPQPNPNRESQYADLFQREGIARSPVQDANNDFPIDCFYPGIPGGHNADFAPNNKHVYVGMAGGATSIIDVNRWKIANNVDIGIRSGPGHTCFSNKHNIAITTNHGTNFVRTIMDINSDRPYSKYFLRLPFARAGLINTYQSHSCYIDDAEDFYYNFWTDGGVFYKMNLAAIVANTQNGNSNLVTASLVTGGIPIQGSYLYVKNIKSNTPSPVFAAVNDTATSSGSAVTIDVLQNDTGLNLAIQHADGATNGQVQIVNGKVVYTPKQGYSGSDGFWYGISSSQDTDWKWAHVDVTITSTVPPVVLSASDDTATTVSGQAVTINVLDNDTGNGLTLDVIDSVWTGTVAKSGNSIVYQPSATFVGSVSFWYSVKDSSGNDDWAKVTVTVGNSGSIPLVAINDTENTTSGNSVNVYVLANDSGNGLTISSIDAPTNGTASIVGDHISYQAPAGYSGVVTFNYSVTDSTGATQSASVSITVTNPNSTVFAVNNDTATVVKGQSVTINVLDNDTGQNLILSTVDTAWTGTLSQSGNSLVYQAPDNYTGDITIWYGATESATGIEKWASVTITVTDSGTMAFTVNNDTATVRKGQAVTINVLGNDTGQSLVLSTVDSAWTGTVTKSGNSMVYQAASGYTGDITIWYGATESASPGVEKWASVTITITN